MGKTAIIFPGQGSQAVGMGRDFAEASPRAATVFEAADEILGFGLSRLCFEGPAQDLERTDVQQPAIFVTSVAVWEAMLEKGLGDDRLGASAGLSLGEYTALHVAGSMGFESALKLVAARGRLMQEASLASPSGMASVIGADEAAVRSLCEKAAQGDVLGPANFNCPGQIAISGSQAACRRAVELAPEFGARAIALKVAGAFHSPFMAPAAQELAETLADTPMTRPRVPVVSNVTADYHGDAESIQKLLRQQLTSPVCWAGSMERLISDGFDTFVEVGPGRVLTGLMRKINRQVRAISVGRLTDMEKALAETAAK